MGKYDLKHIPTKILSFAAVLQSSKLKNSSPLVLAIMRFIPDFVELGA
jgi:hypothetical protein